VVPAYRPLGPAALQRNSTFQPLVAPPLTNGDQQVNEGRPGVLVIPTINGETLVANQEGARVNLSDLEVRFAKYGNHFFYCSYRIYCQ